MKSLKSYTISTLVNERGMLICPVCGKEFEPNDDTKYIAAGGYTCDWKCFWTEVRRREKEKKIENEQNPHKNKKCKK